MSWLRIDDGYDTHPKLLELTEQQRWRWTRVLIHCARHQTQGHVKPAVLRELVLTRTIPALLNAGLLEPNGDDGYLVHDWQIYNGQTIENKVAAYLLTYPDASANSICKAVGGKREIVLAVISQFRSGTSSVPGGTNAVPHPVPPVVPGNHFERYPTGSRARAPVPSRPSNPVTATQNVAREADQPGHGHGEQRTDQELEALAATVLHDMPA